MMTDKTVRGRFVWHELMTPDTSAAHSFYSKTLGWKSQASDDVPDYSMFVASGGPLGGSVALPAGAPHWLTYIGTPDIEATVAQAQDLGAKVIKEVEEIPGMGKYAVLNDPQGAQFAVYSSSADPGRDKPAKRGEFSWHELMSTDAKAALDFYAELFGWEKRNAHDMGPMGFYYLFGRNGQEIGGMFDKPANVPGGPAWLGYVRVKDVNQTVKKIKSAGGTLTNGPMEVPGGDWIAQFVDPHGAAFAVHTVKADVSPAEAEETDETDETDETEESEETSDADEAVAEQESEAELEAPAAKPAKPKKVAKAAKKPAAKVATPAKSAKKKSAPAAKVRAAAKSAKRPAGKAAKASSKKAPAKKAPAKSAKVSKPVKGAKAAKVTKAAKTTKVTKGAKAKSAKKPARKK
jgi:predicted enzyme related to lactoylglutathione lyase